MGGGHYGKPLNQYFEKQNMKYQAKKLMEEMMSSKNISFKEDWKVKNGFQNFNLKNLNGF